MQYPLGLTSIAAFHILHITHLPTWTFTFVMQTDAQLSCKFSLWHSVTRVTQDTLIKVREGYSVFVVRGAFPKLGASAVEVLRLRTNGYWYVAELMQLRCALEEDHKKLLEAIQGKGFNSCVLNFEDCDIQNFSCFAFVNWKNDF